MLTESSSDDEYFPDGMPLAPARPPPRVAPFMLQGQGIAPPPPCPMDRPDKKVGSYRHSKAPLYFLPLSDRFVRWTGEVQVKCWLTVPFKPRRTQTRLVASRSPRTNVLP